MIDYDYRLTIDMGTKKPTYAPVEAYKGPLKNIFRLEGENMSGKSTLMNLIALSSFGLKNSNINKVLQKHLDDMVSDVNTELTFRVRIEDPVSGKVIRAERKSPHAEILIEDSEDGKTFSPLSDDSFSEKYNLIYDIPENPIDRLADISHEIEAVHQKCSSSIGIFQKKVDSLLYELDVGRDEERIAKSQHDIQVYEENERKDPVSEEKKKKYPVLEKLYYAMKIKEAKVNETNAKQSYEVIKRAEEGKEARPQRIKSTYDGEVNAIRVIASPLLSARNELEHDVKSLQTPDLYAECEIIRGFDINSVIRERKVPVAYLDAVHSIEKKLSSQGAVKEKGVINATTELINVLTKYKNQDISLPHFGSIDALLNKLQYDLELQKKSMGSAMVSERILENASAIEGILRRIDSKVISLNPPVKESEEDKQYCDKEKVESAKRKADAASVALHEICVEAMNKGVTLSNHVVQLSAAASELNHAYDNASVSEVYHDMVSEKKVFEKAVKDEEDYRQYIVGCKLFLERMDKIEENPYSLHKSALKMISNSLMVLKGQINESMNKLIQVEKKSYGKYDGNDPYFKAVWTYLGKRVKFVRYEKDSYPVLYVNTVDDIITATDGTVLRLRQISTGLNQRNYLMSKLETDDNRPIIALFDEVSTMTDTTQNEIFDKFIELQKQGKLMVGMMNKPADKKKVTSFGL